MADRRRPVIRAVPLAARKMRYTFDTDTIRAYGKADQSDQNSAAKLQILDSLDGRK
jgi:hypothetical protein